jgi:5-methylcytosine-specific restriction endonuclease McrA
MGAVHEVVRKSNSGSTKRVELVYFEITNPKTYASYVLLKNFYWENDADNLKSIANRLRIIGFSRRYLTNIQKKEGSVTCTYCKKPDLVIELEGMKVPQNIKATIDHIIPISEGGPVFDESNITPCCGKCNGRKGSLSVEVFLKIVKPWKSI